MNTAPQRSSSARTVGIITAVVGGLALLGAVGTVAVAATLNFVHSSSSENNGVLTLDDVAGVTAVSVDASAAEFTLEFADVADVRLETAGDNPREWTLDRRGTVIMVDQANSFGFCLVFCGRGDEYVTLTLPLALQGSIDADLELGAGSLIATGDFRDLDLEVSAGSATATGSAKTLDVALSAGRADLQLADVQEARFEVSAGKMVTELTGNAPQHVDAEVSAGSLEVTLPDVPYDVTSEVAAGSLTNTLREDNRTRNTINVEVAAGEIILTPAAR